MKINGVRFNDKEVSVLRAFVSKVIEAGLPSQFDIRACDMTEVDASEFENKLFEAQLNISRTSSDFTIRANPIIDAFESDATANHKIHDVPTSQIEILDEVDSGLFGKVYKARQTDPGRAHLIWVGSRWCA